MPLIELYGHAARTEDLALIMQAKRDLRAARGGDERFAFPHDVNCRNCGRNLGFMLDEKDHPVIDSQWPSLDEFHRKGMREELPATEPCPLVAGTPIRVPFTCKSGRVALGNDLRPLFEDRPGFDSDFDINCLAGKKAWMEHLSTYGYLLGSVGNTSVRFVPRDGGLDVVELHEPEYVGSDKTGYRRSRSKAAREVQADEKASVHKISTELWWFAIADAADLPEGATDTYDRPLGFMDLEPGEYEMTYYTHPWGFARDITPHRCVWAEIRRKGSNSDPSA